MLNQAAIGATTDESAAKRRAFSHEPGHQPNGRRLVASFSLGLFLAVFLGGCQQNSSAPVDTSLATAATARPVANTIYGPVRGYVEDGVKVFKGIRYGADTATTRFAAPNPPTPWTEPQDALLFGNSAPQPARATSISLFKSWANPQPGMGEDCLFLNVWTQGSADRKKRPVMVWLHGGGFTTGSGSSHAYDGVRLANRGDVVVVTVNHRLNLFGYLYLGRYGSQFGDSGTAGMLDLIAALEWVRDNIEEFGGDPDNVTIFGESGGGWKVSTLMSMRGALGLFNKAIVQSGPALELTTRNSAKPVSAALIAELGLNQYNIDRILTLPVEQLQAASAAVSKKLGLVPGSRPVIDRNNIVRHPFSPAAPDLSIDVPLLIGSTRTEMSLLAGARNPQLFDLTWDSLPGALSQSLENIDAAPVIAGYRARYPHLSPAHLYFEALGDNSNFVRGSFTLADRKVAKGGAPVFQYFLNWNTPVDGGKWGAPHALDIGFVFDNVAKSESMSGVGPEQQALADKMSEAWLAFARTGNPSHAGLPSWPEYNAEQRPTMIFDNEAKVVNDPRRPELNLIDAALRKQWEIEYARRPPPPPL